MKLLVSGSVTDVSDVQREFPSKENPALKTTHRIVSITVLTKEGSMPQIINIGSWDLPSGYPLPKVGDSWTSPELSSVECVMPNVYKARLNVS